MAYSVREALVSVSCGLELAASIYSGLWPAALGHVSSAPHLSPRVLPLTSVTHFYMGYCSFIDPGRMKVRVCLVG